MKKIMTIDGNEACSYTAYMFTEVAGIYPITPSSPMAEHLDEWSSNHRLNVFNDEVKVVEMQSELGAAGMVHGSLQAGLLTTTFTASQGLLLMIPNMYKIAGEMLPGVIHVAARSLSTHALSIFGDHQDIYATRMTGFAMLASSSVQDAAYLSAVAHLSAIKSSLPFLHFFDGFRTSHEINKIEVLEQEDLKELIDYEALNRFRNKALNPLHPVTRGVNENDDIYFQNMEVRNKYYEQLPDIVNEYMEKINEKANTNYKPFNYYGSKNAKKIIVAMGSVTDTIKEYITDSKENIGLIEVHLYRPFSSKYLLNVLPDTVEKIAVLDRTKEPGSGGEPLYLDISNALKNKNISIVGGRYGLSSKNTTPAQIKAVYDMLDNPRDNFVIGINDDVTHLSLEIQNYKINNAQEMLIYGYGSDGMISASKSLIKLIGDNTDKYVQGYFEYDSKKSGGVTVSHLRFKDDIIRKPYYVENPSVVVVSKDSYLSDFDMFNNICENGICIINTVRNEEEINELMSSQNKKDLLDKKIKIYTINAYLIAHESGLNNKISMIMENAILKLIHLIDFDKAQEKLKEYIKNKFSKKGEKVVESNYQAIEAATKYIKEIKLNNEIKQAQEKIGLYEMIGQRKGNKLPTSAFLKHQDGTFNETNLNKSAISEFVPKWLNSNCIRCNRCSFVCPHSVIRTYLVDEEEYQLMPSKIKERCIKPLDKNLQNYYFIIGISIKNCTGCGLCVNTCPGLRNSKALIMEDILNQSEEQKIADYLLENIKDKEIESKNNIMTSQFKKPKIKYPGACLGCGQPAYIKILTQLFGNEMIIANATGCSSIYGGSIPNLPYNLPWASSLFEDNAEYGYGMYMADKTMKNRIKKIIHSNLNNPNKELFEMWLNNMDDYKTTKYVYDNLTNDIPEELKKIKDYLIKKSTWIIGGDGWAYDIGFSGIDHILASNDNVNILVLNTEVYSNTGGQASKASPKGSIASFATSGKKNNSKDLARIAMSYPDVYVAQINLGANMNQVIKAMKEAEEYKGPSLIIAYAPCISHGIEGGMTNSLEMQALATKCGYFPIFRYNPVDKKLILDSKNVDFDLYNEFLLKQQRYKNLKKINKENADLLFEDNKNNAILKFNYYKMLSEKED